mgnify:FL=1
MEKIHLHKKGGKYGFDTLQRNNTFDYKFSHYFWSNVIYIGD